MSGNGARISIRPAHFHQGMATIDKIPLNQMLLPLVVIDVHRQVAKNPDYVLTMADVKAWEKRHGPVPSGAFVAMRTDWAKRWPSQEKMQNVDAHGVAHYPGWSKATLKYLYETRHITASGHETTDTDPGLATTKDDYSLESYILGLGHYQIELLANLDKVPDAGAIVAVTWPDLKDGTGFPGAGLRDPAVGASAHFDGRREDVAGAAHRLDDGRLLRIGLELAAQPPDLHVDGAVERAPPRGCARDRAAGRGSAPGWRS